MCPIFFGALFFGALYLGKMPKGVGGEAVPKDLDYVNGFILLNSIKIVLNLGKMSKGGGVGACQKYWSTFIGLFTT